MHHHFKEFITFLNILLADASRHVNYEIDVIIHDTASDLEKWDIYNTSAL
jgi:hypothetical protein